MKELPEYIVYTGEGAERGLVINTRKPYFVGQLLYDPDVIKWHELCERVESSGVPYAKVRGFRILIVLNGATLDGGNVKMNETDSTLEAMKALMDDYVIERYRLYKDLAIDWEWAKKKAETRRAAVREEQQGKDFARLHEKLFG